MVAEHARRKRIAVTSYQRPTPLGPNSRDNAGCVVLSSAGPAIGRRLVHAHPSSPPSSRYRRLWIGVFELGGTVLCRDFRGSLPFPLACCRFNLSLASRRCCHLRSYFTLLGGVPFLSFSTDIRLSLIRLLVTTETFTYTMAPHAEDSPVGTASNGHTVPVNDGQAPMEPGVKKNIAQGKMTEFPRYVGMSMEVWWYADRYWEDHQSSRTSTRSEST